MLVTPDILKCLAPCVDGYRFFVTNFRSGVDTDKIKLNGFFLGYWCWFKLWFIDSGIECDRYGRIVKFTTPDGLVRLLSYADNGQVLTIHDVGLHVRVFLYADMTRTVTRYESTHTGIYDPAKPLSSTAVTINAYGDTTRVVCAGAVILDDELSYGGNGKIARRLNNVTGRSYEYSYDGWGNILKIDHVGIWNSERNYAYQYDSASRLVRAKSLTGPGHDATITYIDEPSFTEFAKEE